MDKFDRAVAVAHFLSCTSLPRAQAIRDVAERFGVCDKAVEGAVEAAAVRAYLHGIGLTDEPARVVLCAAAKHFRFSDADLQAAVDAHLQSPEA